MPLTEAAIFLVLTVDSEAENTVRDLLADASGLKRSVGFRIPEGQLTCVVGVGAVVWDRLFGVPRPSGLHGFRALSGARHAAPATAGDLLFHIRAHRMDLCFELAQRLTTRLVGAARVVDEVHAASGAVARWGVLSGRGQLRSWRIRGTRRSQTQHLLRSQRARRAGERTACNERSAGGEHRFSPANLRQPGAR
jgi:hypothetical protein